MIIGIQAVLTKLKAFVDNFDRANNANTLAGSSGASTKWINYRGTWGISSNTANTATAASSYPLAAIKTGSVNATVKIYGSSQGFGSAYWVEDADNWYATYTDQTSYSTGPFTAYTCVGSYTQNCQNGQCADASCTGGNGPCNPYQPCSGFSPGSPVINCPGSAGMGSNPAWAFCGYQCSGGNPGSCTNVCGGGCGFVNACANSQCGHSRFQTAATSQYYNTNYLYFLRTLRNQAGSVTTLNSTSVSSQSFVQAKTNFPTTNSVRITHSGGTYDIATSNPIQGKSHGVMLAPASSGSQATSVDNFEYTPTV